MLGPVNPVPGVPKAPSPHNPTPATLGVVPQSGQPRGAGAQPLGAAPPGAVRNASPSTLGVTTATVPHNPTPSTLGRPPQSVVTPQSQASPPPAANAHQAVPNHTATPPTLGAVPRVATQQGPAPIWNPTPGTLGIVPHHARPQGAGMTETPDLLLGPINGPLSHHLRHSWGNPSLVLAPRGRRTPLVNYAPGTMKLSILIPTLTKRAALLGQLMRKLEAQIKELGPVPEVEVLILEDNKETPVGRKRNRLLMEAKGDFVVFVDDDDDLSDDYVWQIYTAILDHRTVDCFGFRAMITVNGQNPRQVIYSLQNRGNGEASGTYLRPPGHLTPIRRSIAQQYRFPDAKNFGEDTDWALSIIRANALKAEFFIDKILYHYRFSTVTSETIGTRPPTPPAPPPYSVVILSAHADNLEECIAWLLEKEPFLDRNRIIVVDDGARAGWKKGDPGLRWVGGSKPFVFARNANIGIRAADTDVLLLNDDARLTTRFGFTSLSYAARSRPDIGLCSAAISGIVGNPHQHPWEVAAGLRIEPHSLAFVAVYIPKAVYQRLGALDENFTGYGYEDNDYCVRAHKAGLSLAIYDGCIVEHSVKGNSSFRTRSDIQAISERNRQIFNRKWGAV